MYKFELREGSSVSVVPRTLETGAKSSGVISSRNRASLPTTTRTTLRELLASSMAAAIWRFLISALRPAHPSQR